MSHLNHVLAGGVATCALVVALFFLRFWRQTGDRFFLLFSAAFAVDAGSRFTLAVVEISDAAEPIYYLPRLLMFGLILVAIIQKNAGRPLRKPEDPS